MGTESLEWFLNRNSAELGKTILSEVGQVMHGSLMPMLVFVAQGIVTLAMVLLLIAVDPMLALTVAVVLGLSYSAIYSFMRGRLSEIGSERVDANESRFTTASEA